MKISSGETRDLGRKIVDQAIALEIENLQLRSALTAIRDRIWRDNETYDERIGDLKWLATEALTDHALTSTVRAIT